MKGKQRRLGTESCLTVSDKNGARGELLSIPLNLQKAVVAKKLNYKIQAQNFFVY